MPTILTENRDPHATSCGYIHLTNPETGSILYGLNRCGAEATVAEIMQDDWRACFLRCDRHKGRLWDRGTYIRVHASNSKPAQLIMAAINVLDEQMLAVPKRGREWWALADSKHLLFKSLLHLIDHRLALPEHC